MKLFLDSIFYSYAQIFFSNRKWFGIGALLISFIDPAVGAMGLLGVLLSNAFALYLKFDNEKIRKGFYGFNGILIGAAIAFFFKLSPFIIGLAVIFIFLAFFISASLEHLMANLFNLPGLSLPFILTLYVFLIVITNFQGIHYRDVITATSGSIEFLPEWLNLFFSSLALILLQSSAWAGILLWLIILAFSRVMFLNSLIAFAINYAIVISVFPNPSHTFLILTSFNAVLTAFALGGSMIILSKKTIPLLLMTIFFIITFTLFFENILSEKLLPVLVLPFNIVTLSTIYSLKFRQENTDLTLLYFPPGSPEENFYYHSTRLSRFASFKYLFPELPFLGKWTITQAFDGEYTHKEDWKYAWDFEIADENGSFYHGDGKEPSDYYCFNTPVVAPLDGKIARVIDNVRDNEIGEVNLEQNWGNTIIIDHGEGLFSSLSHLKRKSALVKEGDEVKKGQIIARCGNSGRSPKPHLHFQFQLTDKLGDKTYKFPLAHYNSEKDGTEELHVFDFPKQNERIRNIDVHKSIKEALNFKLGDKLEFVCEYNGTTFEEIWTSKVDILNVPYLENENGDRLNIYATEKIFYVANYVGSKKSALYFFYLAASKVPLEFSEQLRWDDPLPVGFVVDGLIRYASEFLLLLYSALSTRTEFKWVKLEDEVFVLLSKLKTRGKGIFSFYQKEDNGKLIIDTSKGIREFHFSKSGKEFKAVKKE
jgi:urea transporter